MLPSKPVVAVSSLRKLQPQAKLPVLAVLETLTADDVELLQRRLSEPIECVFDAVFQRADAERTFLGPLPEATRPAGSPTDQNDDSSVDLLTTFTNQSLTTDQERHLFLRLNYCRYRAMRILRQQAGKRLGLEAANELIHWEKAAVTTRGEIVRANVPLVLAMAKRTKITGVDFADLISEGNLALLRSVDKFDCARGFKFSTYACRAILKSFSRVASRAARYRGQFPTEFDPTLEKSDFVEQKRLDMEGDCVSELKSILGKNLANLNEVEQRVIRARFALEEPPVVEETLPRAKTLEQVGEMIGVTKERVRQIQNKALRKLRLILEEAILTA